MPAVSPLDLVFQPVAVFPDLAGTGRNRLEVVDRELAFLDRDAQKKLEAFEKARTVRKLLMYEKMFFNSFKTRNPHSDDLLRVK